MFEKGQKVWCAIYGAGVVKRIREEEEEEEEEEVDYPVIVVFNRNGDENVVSYTADGKYHEAGNVTLFPHPIEITKAVTKPSIDWNHVNENFQYLAMDADGESYLYTDKPQQGEQQWIGRPRLAAATHFASFTPGTCNWRDSLVKRPN